MVYLIIALAALGIISAIFGLLSHNKEGGNDVIVDEGDCASCTGTNEKCEQTCMMEAATRPVEYFDDEELDRFRRRSADSYTDDEIDEFREVLYTTLRNEVADWLRSLQLREIELPEQLREEALMLTEE